MLVPKAVDRDMLMADFLDKSTGFINPNNVDHLCTELGLPPKGSSLLSDLDGTYLPTYPSFQRL